MAYKELNKQYGDSIYREKYLSSNSRNMTDEIIKAYVSNQIYRNKVTLKSLQLENIKYKRKMCFLKSASADQGLWH